jgi:hypothetical protein
VRHRGDAVLLEQRPEQPEVRAMDREERLADGLPAELLRPIVDREPISSKRTFRASE